MRYLGRKGSVELQRVKPPAVAGRFYPGNATALRRTLGELLAGSRADHAPPKAMIAPHAGYQFSGAVAANAYAHLATVRERIRRVGLLGPAHYAPLRGAALSSARVFTTPLGTIPVDEQALGVLREFEFVQVMDAAFEREHSLEVHLPFLQTCLADFRLVPVLIGETPPQAVNRLLAALWGGPETLIVVSSDLSHFLDYGTAKQRDAATSTAVVELRPDDIGYADACGRNAVNGLLHYAREHGIRATAVDVRNSGDTAGPKDRVVGYGAYLFHEAGTGRLSLADRRRLLGVAAGAIRHGLEKGGPKQVDPDDFPKTLRAQRATFVTLRRERVLRGCIGSLSPARALVCDVADNAYRAAFADPRFAALTEEEFEGLEIGISVLSAPEPVAVETERDLLGRMRPGTDGIILEEGKRRSTFLPAVWESLPDPEKFLAELKKKGGWEPDYWSTAIKVWRYTAESFS